MRSVVLFFVSIIIGGCENLPVYEEFTTSKKTFECLSLDVNDTKLFGILKKEISFSPSADCAYKLRGYIHESSKCTSLYAKTHGTDFDGYVYLEIKIGKDRLYRVQSDYKDDLNGSISRVVTKVNTIVREE